MKTIVLVSGRERIFIKQLRNRLVMAVKKELPSAVDDEWGDSPEPDIQSISGPFDPAALALCRCMPREGKKKLVVLTCELSELDSAEFREYVKDPTLSTFLMIEVSEIRKNARIYKVLLNSNQVEIKSFDKVSLNDNQQHSAWYAMLLKSLRVSKECFPFNAYQALAYRLGYHTDDAITLETIYAIASRMLLTDSVITEDRINKEVEPNEQENIFALMQYIENKDRVSALRQMGLISNGAKNGIETMSALLRQYRVAYKLALLKEEQGKTDHEARIAVNIPAWQKIPVMTSEKAGMACRMICSIIDRAKKGYITDTVAMRLTCQKLMAEHY